MGYDRGEDDDLPAWNATPGGPDGATAGAVDAAPRRRRAVARGGRRDPRRWRLGRVATVLLVLAVLVPGSVQLLLTNEAQRLAREERVATRQLNATAATPFLWDTEAGLPELVDDGATIYLQPQGDDGAEIAKGTDAVAYPLGDALGSVRAKTSGATGAVVATADFDPWGASRATSGGAPALGFAGEQRDATTGLTHLRARDYDPLRGQFLGRDGVSPNGPATQGYSAYGYTAGNPVSRTDPSGHDAVEAAGWGLLVAALYGALQRMIPTFQALDRIPEQARGLVRGLLLLGLSVLRQMLVWAIVNLTVQVVAAQTGIDTLGVGKALLTLGTMQLFSAYRGETKACVAASWRACVGLFQMLPVLPLVSCLASLALFTSDYQALFTGAPVTEEEALYASLDLGGLVGDCAGVGGGGKGGGGSGDGPDKPRDGNWEDLVGGCNSFPAGTGVLLADGSTAPIEDVRDGDAVLAADPLTGEAGARSVTDAWHHADGPLVTLDTIDARGHVGQLTATAAHAVWEVGDRAWEQAGELQQGDALQGADGLALTVLAVENAGSEVVVYDLTVADLHTFYVASGAGWVLVHNAGCVDVEARWNQLLPGDKLHVRTVGSDAELRQLYKELTGTGISFTRPGYDGQWMRLPDGTTVGLRESSRAGGATIDIVLPNGGKPLKVHIE